MNNNKRRVALVVGGSGGIGRAITSRLTNDQMQVIATARTQPKTARDAVEFVELDVTDKNAGRALCERVHSDYGSLDVLVNCAAINREAPALGMDDAEWQEVLDVNLSGAFRLCQAAGKYMVLGRWGRIINFSSIAASFGGRGQINYVAAKAGVQAMTRTLALELGRKGVLVNCIAPGIIETKMSERIREQHSDELLSAIAMKRFGQPDDIADVVSFLASDAARYITGQTIHVDGGMGL